MLNCASGSRPYPASSLTLLEMGVSLVCFRLKMNGHGRFENERRQGIAQTGPLLHPEKLRSLVILPDTPTLATASVLERLPLPRGIPASQQHLLTGYVHLL
jgi:hypothetical protein